MRFIISENELLNILRNLTNQEHICLTKHVIEKLDERPLDLEWIYDNIINKTPLYIENQGFNLFKLHYEHPVKNYKDMIIVIFVKNNKRLKIVTTYEQDIHRRY